MAGPKPYAASRVYDRFPYSWVRQYRKGFLPQVNKPVWQHCIALATELAQHMTTDSPPRGDAAGGDFVQSLLKDGEGG